MSSMAKIFKLGPLFNLIFFLLAYLVTTNSLFSSINAAKALPNHHVDNFNRTSFPSDFLFGVGSAAYQSEGAAYTDGRGPSIWDTFVKNHPEKISDASTGNVADDFYHRYKEDIKLMKKIGLDSFRLSISWTRIFPKGKVSGGVNPLGVKFYNNVINELLGNGIKPLVTLLHYDPPQALDDEYGGPLSSKFVNDYRDFADFSFKTFGDRVKYWITMNEPNGMAINGYSGGTFAPGRCSKYVSNCSLGNSATEPYIITHNLLLAHSAAVNLYRQKYQPYQKGQIGITIACFWFEPLTKKLADLKASTRMIDFLFGWYVNPVVYGDYPETMKSIVGNRLPKFTPSQSKAIKGTIDFIGLNYYSAYYVTSAAPANGVNVTFYADAQVTQLTARNGVLIGPATELSWLYVYPKGIVPMLNYIKKYYNDPAIIITENGYAYANNASKPLKENLRDTERLHYHYDHLVYLSKAIKGGVKVKGYYAWSFWDDFEWDAGYTVGFGLTYVDFKTLDRHLRYSGYWYKKFLLH